MRAAVLMIRNRLDRAGIVLSGLCAVHCLISVLLVGGLGLGGELLLNPAIHEVGLGLAIFIGVVTLGIGAMRHGAAGPLIIGACGLALMAVALGVNHGPREAVLTVIGVSLVAFAHLRNLRQSS
jgi:MerC mercury resistance protein